MGSLILAISIAAWVLTIIAAGFWVSVAVRIVRELLHARPLARRTRAAVDPADLPSVVVIVPAHNEAHCIGRLIESLLEQDYPKLRVRIALDRCTDETETIVRSAAERDSRLDFVVVSDCPADWAGKVHAAYSAVTADDLLSGLDDSSYLLFTDADTTFDTGLVRTTVEVALHDQLGLVSLLPTLRIHRWFERIVQPIAVGQFLQIYPLRKANRPGRRRRPVANGQFMLFRKNAYLEAGTHKAMRKFLLEDLAFARKLHRRGITMGLFPAGPLLRCEMYDRYVDFCAGWKRIYIDSLHHKVSRLRKASQRQQAIGWGLMLTYAANLASVAVGDVTGGLIRFGAILLAQVAILAPAYIRQGAGLWPTLAHPFAALCVGRILAQAASDLSAGREIRWGGRTYKLKPRTGER